MAAAEVVKEPVARRPPRRDRPRATSAAVPARRPASRLGRPPIDRAPDPPRPRSPWRGSRRPASPLCPRSAGRPAAAPWPTCPRSTGRGSTPTARPAPSARGPAPASEQAVERALDWLARHQDTDGRWDGGTAQYDDGTPVKGDDDFTVHCPPGETCFGECIYWEADTALTGLALLSYLGAGYTQTDGKYAETVAKGLDFLLAGQKPDGDLRGKSRAVGMYCHAMATIALCEAYALTGDERLRAPGRARRRLPRPLPGPRRPGLAVRPRRPGGRHEHPRLGRHGLEVGPGGRHRRPRRRPDGHPDLARQGRQRPIERPGPVSARGQRHPDDDRRGLGLPPVPRRRRPRRGQHRGGALPPRPRPQVRPVQPLLLVLRHPRHVPARRRRLVPLERPGPRRARPPPASSAATRPGAGTPTTARYGSKGGRIYCTALATLTLEVYYRYLRLYDDPKIPPAVAPRPRPAAAATRPSSALRPPPGRFAGNCRSVERGSWDKRRGRAKGRGKERGRRP